MLSLVTSLGVTSDVEYEHRAQKWQLHENENPKELGNIDVLAILNYHGVEESCDQYGDPEHNNDRHDNNPARELLRRLAFWLRDS
ncbi:hypothetical protein [Microbacterium sp. VKM Ac-2923]|uniref:hypothetical protein n=1 Tax=Microbacterium sp. VKM Ac-2923 TaxID=2929476 RepID=UPI001FB4D348|nr:hypothetical protein [Microbacterium sp. VKM Ac-2923]MCJ1707109.1 hypothetical protein [Microbacterium sp. VKM Ac-2923]